MKKFILDFLRDEDGQTSTEYILLVAVVAMIIFKFKDKLDSGIGNITDKIFGEGGRIEKLLQE